MLLMVCVRHTLLGSVHLLFHHLICSWFRIAYLRAEKILCHPESNERNGAFLVICPCFSDTDLQFNLVIEDECWGYLSVHPSSLIFKSDFLLSQDVLDQKKYSYGTELCPLHCECTSVCVFEMFCSELWCVLSFLWYVAILLCLMLNLSCFCGESLKGCLFSISMIVTDRFHRCSLWCATIFWGQDLILCLEARTAYLGPDLSCSCNEYTHRLQWSQTDPTETL